MNIPEKAWTQLQVRINERGDTAAYEGNVGIPYSSVMADEFIIRSLRYAFELHKPTPLERVAAAGL